MVAGTAWGDMSTDTGDPPIIEFASPMPGFPDLHRFVLSPVDDDGLLYTLLGLEAPRPQFLVAVPAPFFPDYHPQIDDGTLAVLGSAGVTGLVVLLVINAGTPPAATTANLLAPIVIDPVSRRAAQVVLNDHTLPIRAPLSAGPPCSS